MAKTAEPSTDIATLAPTDLVAILTTPEKFDDLIGRIRKEVAEFVPDLTTATGRKAIASLAYKVARTKTALDDAGKELNADKRKEIDAVDAVRRDVRAKLDDLSAQARKPLDEWEAKEAERASIVANFMQTIDSFRLIDPNETSTDIQGRIDALNGMVFDADVFQEGLELAINAKASALEFLGVALNRAIQAEADAAELAALRKREAEREEMDRQAAAIAAQAEADRIAEENRKTEAKRVEDQRIADAAEAERKRLADIAAAEQRAADAAKAEAARLAQVELDAANAEISKANAAAENLRRAEAARVAEQDRIASETAAREADKAHRGAVMKAAKEAIMASGDVDENAAKKIVLAIVAGEIPNVRIVF